MRKVTLWSGATSVDFSVSLGVGCRRIAGGCACTRGEAAAVCGALQGPRRFPSRNNRCDSRYRSFFQTGQV